MSKLTQNEEDLRHGGRLVMKVFEVSSNFFIPCVLIFIGFIWNSTCHPRNFLSHWDHLFPDRNEEVRYKVGSFSVIFFGNVC